MSHGGPDAGTAAFEEGLTVHEQYRAGAEEVNEGLSQWREKSLDERKKPRFFAIYLSRDTQPRERRAMHFGFREEFSKTKEKIRREHFIFFIRHFQKQSS